MITTEGDWLLVFRIRCRSKTGQPVTQDELELCERAMRSDPERYSLMSDDVFDATAPFGSSVRRRR